VSDLRVLTLTWPRQLRPGDERFVGSAIVLVAQKVRCRVRFLFGPGISVLGPHSSGRNAFDFPKLRGPQSYALKFVAEPGAQVGSRCEIAVTLSSLRFVWWRFGLGGLLIAAALLPVLAQAFRSSVLSLRIGLSDAVAVYLPAGVILTLLITWHRVLAAASILLYTETVHEQVITMTGTGAGYVEIVQDCPDLGVATWSAGDDQTD
jgi:hypothetical protein